MPRVVEVFEPIEKGRYWRPIFNAIRDVPHYSIEQVRSIFDSHSRDKKGQLILPYSLHNRPLNCENARQCQDFLQECLDIYSVVEEGGLRGYRKFLPVLRSLRIKQGKTQLQLKGYEGGAIEFQYLSEPLRQLVLTCMGKTMRGFADPRTSGERARDFWFHNGYREFISDLELLFFG